MWTQETKTDPVGLASLRSWQVGRLTGACEAVIAIAEHQPSVPGPVKDALKKLAAIVAEESAR